MDAIKPFCKVITIQAGLTSSISLRDTANNLLECNWLMITTAATVTTSGYFIARPHLTGYTSSSIANTSTTSGIGGFTERCEQPLFLKFDGPDYVVAVDIENRFATAIVFLINYGVATSPNPLKAAYVKPRGN